MKPMPRNSVTFDEGNDSRQVSVQSKRAKLIGLGVAAFIVGSFALFNLPFYTVNQGERAIITMNGAIASVEGPGLHLLTPWVNKAHWITVRDLARTYDPKTLEAYSSDQQPANIAISVRF